MKADELRIGNYINGVLVNETYTVDIWALRIIQEGNFQNSYNTDLKVFEPIPLTEEWLFKFGFLKDLDNDIYLSINPYAFLFWQNNRVELLDNDNNFMISYCKYVHQLQNLYFALTGEELTRKPCTTK